MVYNASSILSGLQGGLFGIGGYFGPGFNIANSLYGGQQPVMQALFSAQASEGKGPYGGQQGATPSAKPANDKRFMPLEAYRKMAQNAYRIMTRPTDTPTLSGFDKMFSEGGGDYHAYARNFSHGTPFRDLSLDAVRKNLYGQDGQ